MHVGCAGPWKTSFKHAPSGKIVQVKILTLAAVDQYTGFPEIWLIQSKSSQIVARRFDAGWLCRNPYPKR